MSSLGMVYILYRASASVQSSVFYCFHMSLAVISHIPGFDSGQKEKSVQDEFLLVCLFLL